MSEQGSNKAIQLRGVDILLTFDCALQGRRNSFRWLSFYHFSVANTELIPRRSNENCSCNSAVRLHFPLHLREGGGLMNLAKPLNLIVFCAAFLFVGAIVVGAF